MTQTTSETPVPPSIRIRPYRGSDRETLRSLTIDGFNGVSIDQNMDHRLGPIAKQPWTERKARHVDDDIDHPNGEVAVAEDGDGRIMGYVSMRYDRQAGVGQIPNIVVDSQARGQGLGRQLLEHALNRFRDEGMTVARIETLDQNPIGQHLYPSLGFREVARQIHYAMSLE